MVSALFERLAAPSALRQAWRRVRRNARAAAGPGRPDQDGVAAFAADSEQAIATLSRSLLDGRYRPGRLRRVVLAKPDGGQRVLAIPAAADRVVQTAAAIELDRLIDPTLSDASFAYRRGRSVAHAIGRVTTYRLWGCGWVVDGDIRRYFDTIPHGPLLRALAGRVDCPAVRGLVAGWLAGFRQARIGKWGAYGVAQGAPISPLLANLYLDPVDRAIDRKTSRLVRYADDFVVLCRDRAAAQACRTRLTAVLATYGLALHPDKTDVTTFARGFEFLGHRFHGAAVTPLPPAAGTQGDDRSAPAARGGRDEIPATLPISRLACAPDYRNLGKNDGSGQGGPG